MRRLVCSPEQSGALAFQNTQVPKPDVDECLVRVKAFSMNRGEVSFAQNKSYGTPIGWDIAGVVEEAAANGSGPHKGTRIAAFCTRMDGWAEYVAVPTDFVAPIPETVSDAVAATLPVAGLTALHSVEKGTRLLGNRVLSTGATGGVGLFSMQLAKLMGAQSIAQVRRPEQADFVRQFGADEVIVTTTGEEAERLAPYRLIVDGVGGELLGNLVKHISKGGMIVSYGSTGGNESRITPYPDLYGGGGQRTIYGLTLYTEVELESAASGLTRLLNLAQKQLINTHIAKEESWEKAGAIADAFLKRTFSGKAVLHIE